MTNKVAADTSKGVNNSSNSEDKFSLYQLKNMDNTIENRSKLSEHPDDDLENIKMEAIDSENYEVAAIIRDTLNDKKNKIQEENNKEFKDNLETNKKENKEEQHNEVEKLKAQLEEKDKKIDSFGKRLKEIEEKLEKNKSENTAKLDDLLKAKNSWDTEKVKKLEAEIKELKEDKANWKKETLKYPGWDLRTLRTKRIKGWITFDSSKTEKGRKLEMNLNKLWLVKNLRSRRKLNKTIRKFNDIGNDPKKWIIYIMSKANKRQWWIVRSEFKKIWNTLTIRDADKFDEVFNKQKKKFIDDLFGKIWTNADTRDTKIKESITKRIDYYQKAYKKKMITV